MSDNSDCLVFSCFSLNGCCDGGGDGGFDGASLTLSLTAGLQTDPFPSLLEQGVWTLTRHILGVVRDKLNKAKWSVK